MPQHIERREPTSELLAGDSPGRVARRLFLATRPGFFPASVAPVIVGSAWGYSVAGGFDWVLFGLALVATLLVHLASNVLNDVGDDLSTGFFDQADRLLQVLFGGTRVGGRRRLCAQVEPDDVGALARQGQRMRATLTPGDTRDERDLAV